jgi:hypothetical protein
MFNLIEKLRQKSDRTKKQIAFLTAFFIVGVIFVVWLSVIYPDFRQAQSQEARVSSLEPSPLSSFSDSVSSGVSSIKEKFSEIKTSVSSLSATTTIDNGTSN